MTLSRQLIITISIVFSILFVGTLALSINNMRTYLTQQLESHAQDTASSLGLSLTPHLKNKDLPLMNSMMDAIFDRGYYSEINLIAIDGTPIIERNSTVEVEQVPAWFINSISLNAPQALSTISIGWKQAARLTVRSHTGYAYLELWNNTVDTFFLFLLSFSAATFGFIIVLKYILSPLKLIEEQALSITRREFPVVNLIPKTRELKRVVVAMNKMTSKVKNMLTEQTETIERVQKEAYSDKLTGLANRRSFDMTLDYTVSAVNDIEQATLLFVRVKGLIEINNEKGYLEGDAVIVAVADIIKRCLEPYSHAFVARTSGEQFGIILPGIMLEASNELANVIAYQIPLANTTQSYTDLCHIGGAWYEQKDSQITIKNLLAKADMALRSSMNDAPNSSRVLALSETGATSALNLDAQQWGKILREGIKQQRFRFFQQPIIALATAKKLHNEIFTKMLSPEGELITGMNFIPMAEKMGLMPELDKNIVESFIAQLKQKKSHTEESFSLNISPSSFHNVEFVEWLKQKLTEEPVIAKQLILETSEYVTNSHIELFKKIVNDFQALGCRFALDHFGTVSKPFGYLHDLNINFIKIHGSIVRGVAYNDDSRFFIESLCQIAHGLDIEVIGEFVEKEEDYIVLKQIGVDAVQGYYIGQVTEY